MAKEIECQWEKRKKYEIRSQYYPTVEKAEQLHSNEREKRENSNWTFLIVLFYWCWIVNKKKVLHSESIISKCNNQFNIFQ